MKKLIIGLLAVAMMLGFASCNKDAETVESGWYTKTVWSEEETLKLYWSEKDAKDAGYPDDGTWYSDTVVIYNNAGFTALVKEDYYAPGENGQFAATPYHTAVMKNEADEPEPLVLPNTIEGWFEYEGMGIINGKAIISIGDYYSLSDEDAVRKEVWTFDDGTELTLYKQGKLKPPVEPPLQPKVD